MSNDVDELIKKMRSAPRRSGGGNYIKGEGLFEVEMISTMRKMAWNKDFTVRDKELFIAEFKIISASSANQQVIDAHVPGTSASWTCKDPSAGGASDVQSFCIALLGVDPRTVKESDEKALNQATLLALAAMGYEEALKRVGIESSWFVGKRLVLETKVTQTKKNTDFTKHFWSPVSKATVA